VELFNDKQVSVVLFYSKKFSYAHDGMVNILRSVEAQEKSFKDITIISDSGFATTGLNMNNLKVQEGNLENLSYELKKAVSGMKSDYVVIIDNRQSEVLLKDAYLETVLMAFERKPKAGMIYADYDLKTDSGTIEKHLLKHHIGRVRDNQDYGKVFFYPKNILINAIDEEVKFKTFYDIRLKISEKNEIVHLANRYSGSLATIVDQGKRANVFDYLLDSKDSQLEAEDIISAHLKRIGAFLAPQANYRGRPDENRDLKASVIIPVGQRPVFISMAIESVFKQTVEDIEVIVVVNGGSDDPTAVEVRKYLEGGVKYDATKPKVRLKVVDINNIGFCLNIGTKMAKGKYYIQLDSDDRLKPNAVEKVIEKFESDINIGMVIGSYEAWELKANGEYCRIKEMPVVTHDEWTEDNGRNNLLRINGAGAPRCIPFEVIKEIGYFDMNDTPFARNYGEDYDIVCRISEKYKIGRIFDPIYEVVRHSGGTDHNIDELTVNRNDEAKDQMRLEAIERRIEINKGT